jgi:hypothetical protein
MRGAGARQQEAEDNFVPTISKAIDSKMSEITTKMFQRAGPFQPHPNARDPRS